VTTPVCSGDCLAKFMLSLRDENFKLLMTEAGDRGITVQSRNHPGLGQDQHSCQTRRKSGKNSAVLPRQRTRTHYPVDGQTPNLSQFHKSTTTLLILQNISVPATSRLCDNWSSGQFVAKRNFTCCANNQPRHSLVEQQEPG